MDLTTLAIAKKFSGNSSSGGDISGGDGGNDQMVVTVQWNQAAGKLEADKTFDEIIEYIISNNHNVVALVYDYPPTETNNSAQLYSLSGWGYDSNVPREYLNISFIRTAWYAANSSSVSISSIGISGTDVVTTTNKTITEFSNGDEVVY